MEDLTATSTDGTRLAMRGCGAGPAIVLVHGTTGGIDTFARIEPLLATRFRVLVYDRRGRGSSGDGPDYALDRELDDLAEVIRLAGEPVHLVGHSFGAVCALAAAVRGAPIRSLTLYEPPLRTDRVPLASWTPAFDALAAGNPDRALERFFELAGIEPDEAAAMRGNLVVWQAMRDGVRQARREIEALYTLRLTPEQFATIVAPTLMITGAKTRSPIYPTPADLATVPHLETVTIDTQRHLAFAFEPTTFAETLTDFIDPA